MTDRRRLAERLAPAGLLLLLAAAWLTPQLAAFASTASAGAAGGRWTETLDGLPAEPVILVAFDPDIGTYPEIRATVRATIADLFDREARLAFVSLTPEGRALFVAERARLARNEANPARLADLGFVPGAEAAIVSIARSLPPAAEEGVLPRQLAEEGPDAVDALLVVGGNDIGPRSWIEQFVPRVEELDVMAIAPTVLLPETQPFAASGQLDALLGTPRDGAAYRDGLVLDRAARFAEAARDSSGAILVGLLVAIAVLLHAWATSVARAARNATRDARERA